MRSTHSRSFFLNEKAAISSRIYEKQHFVSFLSKSIVLFLGFLVLISLDIYAQRCINTVFFQGNGPLLAYLDPNIPALKKSDSEKDSLAFATELMIAKRSKNSHAITLSLIQKLEKEDRLNSPFGLQVRLVHGSALIHAVNNRESFDFLWQLKDDSKSKKQWDIFAETCRVIASILEYSRRPAQSLQNLREAQLAIQQYQLDSIYPHFAVRISSWHHQFGKRDSSLYYAEEAIRSAQKFGKVFEEAEGHLLMAINYRKTEFDTAIYHYNKAAILYKEVGDFTSYFVMYAGLTRLALQKKKPKEAMMYIDTLFRYLPYTFENNTGRAHTALGLKGEAYEQMGQLDSAIFYFKKGHTAQLDHIKSQNLDKVVEIDNKYNVEKKTREIEAKNLEIKAERERRWWVIALAFLILLFSGILVFYILKLRHVNKLTRNQAEQLKALDTAKSRFFANVSHELRTPITLMLGPVSMLLKENNLTEKQVKLLNMAKQSGKQLHQLVSKILDLRKLEVGKMELHLVSSKLPNFFAIYTNQFTSLAAKKQLDLVFESELDDEVTALIDREKCRQLLQNLLSNAFKFTPVGGRIVVNVAMDGEHLQLQVTDSGSGIHPDELPYVFDRFFQTYKSGKPIEGGTGIGLALCREYVKLFGGKIEAKSTLGKGTTFRATFPVFLEKNPQIELIAPLQKETQDSQPIASASKPGFPIKLKDSRPKILLVEDNLQLQEYICLVLQEKYKVIKAENGKTALKIMQDALPDLILSDLMMPIMDGFQLLNKLKANPATCHLPVIMLTARTEQRDRLKALRIGVDDYLSKPFDNEELLIRIDNLLKNHVARLSESKIPKQVASKLSSASKRDQEWLSNFEDYIRNHYSDSQLSVPGLADEFAMSESTLLRQLKRLTGLTPKKYVKDIRLAQARQLLEDQVYDSIALVAYEVGYKDIRTFSRNFKKRYGKSPSELLAKNIPMDPG